MMHRALLQALRGQANKTELCPQGVHALAGEREHRSPRQTGEMGASAGDVPPTARGLRRVGGGYVSLGLGREAWASDVNSGP